ncbi:unnamed protein product [Knipowitschia caucasica]
MEDNDLFDASHVEEGFAALPPPSSPGTQLVDPFGDEEGDVSKLADVPDAKRKVKRPQPKLDSNRLISDRGLPALRTLFNDVNFRGRGHEAEDLRLLMKRMENWAHRLFPKLQFEDFIDKVERLGAKKEVQTCLKRIRLDMPLTHEDYTSKEGEEEVPAPVTVFSDPFEDHLSSSTPRLLHSTPAGHGTHSSVGLSPPSTPSLSEEQRRRMEENRVKALERRLARQKQQHQAFQSVECGLTQPMSSELMEGSTKVQSPALDQETSSSQNQGSEIHVESTPEANTSPGTAETLPVELKQNSAQI